MLKNLLNSLLHNIAVVIVGFVLAFLGLFFGSLFGITGFTSVFATAAGLLLVIVGFLLRVWATFHFYKRRMKVISLVPQKSLITSGPYRFSRNPLYLGGNVFIFFGTTLFLGTPSGLFLTALNILFIDFWIRKEEKQLARDFGKEWISYKKRVRRWL